MNHRIETLPTLSVVGEKENMLQDKKHKKIFLCSGWILMKVVKNTTY
ncbi:hypothetical protein AABD44_10280 [Staphylococcus shinii]